MTKFSPTIEQTLALAQAEAQSQHSAVKGTPHLFIALTKLDGVTAAGLRAQGQHPKAIRAALRLALGQGQATRETEPQLTPRAKANLTQAETLAEQEVSERVEERHLLLAILADDRDNLTLNMLRFCGVDLEALQASLASATPLLDRLGRDLTSLARAGQLDPLIGRRTELQQLVRTLLRKKKNNPVLVGSAGVGKTAIVEGVANLITAGQLPLELQQTRLVELSTATLLAGTKYRGEFEERLLGLIEEVKRAENILVHAEYPR